MPGVAQSDPAPGDPAGYALAYSESVRDLEHQVQSVDELRSRTGTLLAASFIATSFLGAAVLPKGTPWDWQQDWPIAVALLAFVLGIGLCIWVLLPRGKAWVFVNDASEVISGYVEGKLPASIAETHKGLAQQNNSHSKDNAKKLDELYRFFTGAAACLLIQVIFWLMVLWGGTGT